MRTLIAQSGNIQLSAVTLNLQRLEIADVVRKCRQEGTQHDRGQKPCEGVW